VRLCAAMIEHTSVNRVACRAAAKDPALLATDLADYLVRRGLPFRQAHHAVGAVVGLAERLGKPLDQLSLAELQSVEPRFAADGLETFNLEQAMARRNLTGAPGPREVKKQLQRWRRLARPLKPQGPV
jgi:argininosuccinate lyase